MFLQIRARPIMEMSCAGEDVGYARGESDHITGLAVNGCGADAVEGDAMRSSALEMDVAVLVLDKEQLDIDVVSGYRQRAEHKVHIMVASCPV